MKNRGKKIISLCLVLLLVLGMLPITSQNVKAAGNEPLTSITMDAVKGKGLPVINLEMADSSKYDTLKTVKDEKQNISTFTLYDTDGKETKVGITTDDKGEKVYPLTAKGRGNSSWTMATGKKPYNLKFDKKIDLLGMGKAKSWCLIANWVDTSYMRNYMAYNLACEMGMGTPDCKQVALCINGKFEGIYLVTEKVGLNEFRTEIPETAADHDVNGDGKVTEMIVESDSRAYINEEPGAFTTKGGVFFVPKDPDPVDLEATELPEIEKEVNAMEAAILSGENYKDYIDVDSWVDTYIINELAKNPDFGFGYQPCYSSSYLYFREGGKVYAGPVWDFDIGYGRNKYDDMSSEGYRKTASPEGLFTVDTKYYKELIEKTDFQEYVIRRWKQLKANGTLDRWIDSIYQSGHDEVQGLVNEDIAAWGDIDKRVAGTFDVGRKALDFEQECAYVKKFITDRIAWLDTVWNVDAIETPYADGEWTREKVSTSSANPNYSSLIHGNDPLDVTWDGGHGFTEDKNVKEKELGKEQGAIPGVKVNPITLTLDTTGIASPVCAKWYGPTDAGVGFGPEGSKPQITITESGQYVGLVTSGWWVNNGARFEMGKNNNRVYVVTVGADGSVTVEDGAICLDQTIPCNVEGTAATHYGAIEGSDGKFTLKYQSDGKGNYQVPGTGAATDMKLSVVDGGTPNLAVTKRAAGTKYPELLDSFEATYIKVTDGIPESWKNSNPEVVKFDEKTRKVTALKAGTSTITATAGQQNVSLTFTVTEKQATELSKTEIPDAGLYASEDYRRPNPPAKGTWATAAANQIYRFTYKLDFNKDQIEKLNSFYIANGDKNQELSGQGDYYIFVNGTPWLKVDDNSTVSNFVGDYKYTANLVSDKADLTNANQGLKELIQEDENVIDIFMVSSKDGYLDRPYFFGSHKIGEAEPDKPVVEVENVSLDVSKLQLEVDQEQKLVATITPSDATNQTLTWTSSNEEVAKVGGKGKVTALKEGMTIITVTTANGKTASATVTVVPKPVIDVNKITLDKESAELIVGNTLKLNATVEPEDAADKALTWTSSDNNVASVDQDGNVKANKVGTATITVKSVNNITATATITVVPEPVVDVVSVKLDQETVSLKEGKTLQLTATVMPDNATDKTLTWTSSNSGVASVDNKGMVTAVKEGQTTITAASVNGKKANAVITVTPKQDVTGGVTMPITFASRTAFEESGNAETLELNGAALLDEENDGLKEFEVPTLENTLVRTANEVVEDMKVSKANENSKTKGNANAEVNSQKNNGNGKGAKKQVVITASDKAEVLPENQNILLFPGEAVAFAAKDYQATKQILHLDALNDSSSLTFVTPESEAQKLIIEDQEAILPEVKVSDDGYAYYLIANTGTQSIVLENIWADKKIDWEVSYDTLPTMYEMNAVAFGRDVLEIKDGEFDREDVIIGNIVDFEISTTANVSDLVVKDKARKDGLYKELDANVKILDNEIIWSGQILPKQFTYTIYTFTAVDESGKTSVNPLKLSIKIIRR